MKKKFLAMAIAAITLAPFGAAAQTTSCTDNSPKKECTAKCGKKDGKECRAKASLFEGMNLTDTQKEQLQKLDQSQREARKAQAQARKEDKQRNDSARIAERRASKKEYLEQVKAIVGPDQYVVFLENFFVNGGEQRPGKPQLLQGRVEKAQGMRHGDRRDGRKDGKRPDRPMKMKAQAPQQDASK